MKFLCLLAHGSEIQTIENFKSISELYHNIAENFAILRTDIMYLTINDSTPKVHNFFTGTLYFGDIIYAHIRGQSIDIEVVKDAKNFGLAITENGIGYAFIKDIDDDSIFYRNCSSQSAKVGHMIEKVNGENVLGYRHYNVAQILRNIRIGEKCLLRLIIPKQPSEPIGVTRKPELEKKETIRFKKNGGYEIEDIEKQIFRAEICGRMNELLSSYLGVYDDQLAMKVWDVSTNSQTVSHFIEDIQQSDLSVFNFPEDLIFEIWRIAEDLRSEKNSVFGRRTTTAKKPNRKSVNSIFQ